jgi:hypothetical protein
MKTLCRVMAAFATMAAIPAAIAGVYEITLKPNDADGRTDAMWTHQSNGTVTVTDQNAFLGLAAGLPTTYRSLMEFNLSSIPAGEIVVSAVLQLDPLLVIAQSLFALGWVRHLDATRATGHPVTDFSYADLAGGDISAWIFPGAIPIDGVTYDVTSAIAADSAMGRLYAPLALVEDPNRFSYGYAHFSSEDLGLFGKKQPTLLVTTSPVPAPPASLLMALGIAALTWRRLGRAK